MNSGSSGTTWACPGATMDAPSMAWKYSVLPLLRSRFEHCPQWILLEQKYSVPSRAINVRLPRRWKAFRPPDRSSSSVPPQRPDKAAPVRLGRASHGYDCRSGSGSAQTGSPVRPTVAVARALLVRQERRASHEEHRERRHADVADRIRHVRPVTLVREHLTARAQTLDQGWEANHASVESYIARFGRVNRCPTADLCSGVALETHPRAGPWSTIRQHPEFLATRSH